MSEVKTEDYQRIIEQEELPSLELLEKKTKEGECGLHLIIKMCYNNITKNENKEKYLERILKFVIEKKHQILNKENCFKESAFSLIIQLFPCYIELLIKYVQFDSNILRVISNSPNPQKSYEAFSVATSKLPEIAQNCEGPPTIEVPKVRWYSLEDKTDAEFYSEYNAIVINYKSTGTMWATKDIKNQLFEGKYRIISLDGGGVKALMQLYVLDRLEEEFPGFLARTSLFCGVSASSLLSTQFALGCDIKTAIRLFELITKYVFIRRIGGGVYGPLYTSKYMLKYLQVFYRDRRLGDLPRNVFFISVCAKAPRMASVLFNNFNEENSNIKLVDACMRSSSAPIYFDSYEGYLDGALFENNPVTCAFPVLFGRNGGINLKPKDVVCFSISTGAPNMPYIDQNEYQKAGFLKWAPRTLDLFQYARRNMSTVIGHELLGERYFRLDPKMPNNLRLDRISDCDKIIECGKTIDITNLKEWIKKYWM
ncbi:patatin family phospholipase [Entamoeba histolytica KU27]|uniref:Patatin family phospholipase n=1 Tax=Entamoeba histolytica KU27 TaxID=885311 RepID=M2RL02_ENTHI|nr:patatin family phospholipase [Entamoeba histolytica KU27]